MKKLKPKIKIKSIKTKKNKQTNQNETKKNIACFGAFKITLYGSMGHFGTFPFCIAWLHTLKNFSVQSST